MPMSKRLEVGMRTEVIGGVGVVWSIYYSQVPGASLLKLRRWKSSKLHNEVPTKPHPGATCLVGTDFGKEFDILQPHPTRLAFRSFLHAC